MAKTQKKYSELSPSQLGWFHILLQWLSVRILRVYFGLRYGLKVSGREHLPKKWIPMIVASNHISMLDPPLVSVALDFRPISYMAKVELFENFWMRSYNWAISAFAVNREKMELSTVKTVLRVLKEGQWALGIFPEGTRRQDEAPAVADTKKGVAYFAKTAKVPVLPLGIHNNGKRIMINIGPLIPFADQDLETLAGAIREGMAACVQEAAAKNR
jgi:1-acyl-sn-glycerol-3-phosphate acyltransferase